MDSGIQRVPVFVFPNSITFYLTGKNSSRQLLTLYNPYDFPVRFQVLCTAPSKYTVIDPDGSIGPQSCTDIVIRHILPIAANCNVVDKFRITMQDHSTKQVIGKRDVEAKLLPTEPDDNSNDGADNFQTLPQNERVGDRQSSNYSVYSAQRTRRIPSTNTVNYLAIVAGFISIIGLLLPTKQEVVENTSIPAYLHISGNLKLVFAYVLGLVSYVLFRT